ncbi:MAG: septum formation protein Maf [Clostridia bacterium]|nr:septum formation protein Maf [Clostridia bacterium]
MDIILASASPRRKQLLSMIYSDFKIMPSDIRELVPRDLDVEKCPEYLAAAKAEMVSQGREKNLVIGCDTAVICEGKMLNKPRDTNDARIMMNMLSGAVHKVITGCCLCYMGKSHCFSVSTDVEFFELSEQEIESYISTAEPYDKAGGYGIQSMGALFVKGIHGDYYNVVGLPVSRMKRAIDEFLESDEIKELTK